MPRHWRIALAWLGAGGVVALLVWWLTPGVQVSVVTSPVAVVLGLVLAVAAGIVAAGRVKTAGARSRAAIEAQRAELVAQAEAREAAARDSVEQRLNAERVRLLGRIDHELKNPVMATNLALERLRTAVPGSADAAEAVAVIGSQSERFAGLLHSLRKITDIEHRQLDLEPVQLAEMLRAVLDACATTPAGARRNWSLQLPQAPWPLPEVFADPDLLYLALFNLVDNAVKYTRTEDRIEVRAAESDGGVLVEVADTGAGIPADEVSGVWDELSRASTAHGIAGQGLGLALVRSVVARHGGRAGLRSRVGEGTLVQLWLPTAGPGAATAQRNAGLPGPTSTPNRSVVTPASTPPTSRSPR